MLARLRDAGHPSARHELFESFRGYAWGVRRKFAKTYPQEAADAHSEALLALWRATGDYDPSKHEWVAYAKAAISYGFAQYLRDRHDGIKLSHPLKKDLKKARKRFGDITLVDAAVIARELGVKPTKANCLKAAEYALHNSHKSIAVTDRAGGLGDMGELVDALNEPARSMIRMHYEEGLSHGEIAEAMRLHKDYVRRHIHINLNQLKERIPC